MSDDFQPVINKSMRRGTQQLCLYTGSSGGYLTAVAVRKWFDDVDTVTLAVDRDHSQLGIQPGADGPGDAYSLTKSDYDPAQVAVKTALRELDVDVDDLDETWRFDLEKDGRYVVADLTDLVEHAVGAVHCDVCGRRFESEGAKKTHYTRTHDDPRGALEETDPEAVGEPFPARGESG
jgi:hypothetical protein